jgi:hypothetical protein
MMALLGVLALLGGVASVTGVGVLPAENRTEVLVEVDGAVRVTDFRLSEPYRIVLDIGPAYGGEVGGTVFANPYHARIHLPYRARYLLHVRWNVPTPTLDVLAALAQIVGPQKLVEAIQAGGGMQSA